MDISHYRSWEKSYTILSSQSLPDASSLWYANGTPSTFPDNTSNARSTAALSTHSINACDSCFLYCCRNDDRKFLQAMEEGRKICRRRLQWLWYCIEVAAPESEKPERLPVWRLLINSDVIWLMWGDGDELRDLGLQDAPEVQQSCNRLEEDDLKSVACLLSQRIDHHSQGCCTLTPLPSFLTEIQKMSVQMRLTIILWKSLLACRRIKYSLNASSLNHEIPYLVPQWWKMIPDTIKEGDALQVNEHSWQVFCDRLKQRGHTSHEEHPKKYMWQVWVTVQDVLHNLIYIDIPSAKCEQCIKIRELSTGRLERVKPHVALLWCLVMNTDIFLNGLYFPPFDHPIKHFQGYFVIPSPDTHSFQKEDLVENLFNPVTLEKVDQWFNSLQAKEKGCGMEYDILLDPFLQHTIATLQPLPASWHELLKKNERDLSPHWTEIEVAISNIQSSSPYSISDPNKPFHPASWLCAVVFFTVVKSFGFGSLSTHIFTRRMQCDNDTGKMLVQAALLLETPATQRFQNALKNSGHTCWSGKSCGGYSMADLYSSACSMLLDTSQIPLVGCDQAIQERSESCLVCCANNTFRDLSNSDFLDGIDIAKTTFSRTLRQQHQLENRTKRFIYKLNFTRRNSSLRYHCKKIHREDLHRLHKVLDALTNHVQYALENDESLELFDKYGDIDFGYIGREDGSESELEFDDERATSSQVTIPIDSSSQESEPNQLCEGTLTGAAPLQTAPSSTSLVPLPSNPPFNSGHNTYLSNSDTYNLDDYVGFEDAIASQPIGIYHTSSVSNLQEQTDIPPQSIQSKPKDTGATTSSGNPSWILPISPVSFPQGLKSTVTESTYNQPSVSNNMFIWKPGKPGNSCGASNQPQKLRVDLKRNIIKEKLVSMLKEHKVYNGRLPWKDLFPFVERHGLEIQNWPRHIPEPRTHNGIDKAPQEEVKAIYEALFEKNPPSLRMRISKKRINPIIVDFSDSSSIFVETLRDKGKKRAMDKNEDDEQRASSRRRI
ncbi:hypothetical protein VKT23_014721 [Stygiomarasmius scandens]|uniref:Uncharacterized protein n=1 Tax=Marasmiellus scandens TaxID=2682957 RepID=A0ABR1J4A5_9AGAR